MAAENRYKDHLAQRIAGERDRYHEKSSLAVCRVMGDLEQDTILDIKTSSLRLKRYAKDGVLSKFLEGMLRAADDDREGALRKAFRKGALAKAFERGKEALSCVVRLDYSTMTTPRHVRVEVHLLLDPEDDHPKAFLYVDNASFEYAAHAGVLALHERQNYQFLCINAQDGTYTYFPDRDSNLFRPHEMYDDAVLRHRETMIRYGEAVCEALSLENVKRELGREGHFAVGFSQFLEEEVVHRLFRFTYMDEEQHLILATALDMTWLITNDAAGSFLVDADITKYLAGPEDVDVHAQRREAELNRVLGMTDEAQRDYSGKRVLLVEAHEVNIEVAKEMLERFGFAVDVAIEGAKAVDRYRKEAPATYACIFVDVSTPRVDGYGVARHIRATRRREAKNIPIVALTDNVFEEDIAKGEEAGMTAHLAKPISPHKLTDILTRYVK